MDNSQFLEITSEKFAAFLATRDDIHFQQTSAFGALQVSLGHKTVYFAVKKDGVIVAAILVVMSKIRFGYLAEVHGNPYFSDKMQINQKLINGMKIKLKASGVLKLVVHSNLIREQYNDNWEKISEQNQGLDSFYKDLGFSKGKLSDFEKGFHYNYSKELTGFDTLAKLKKSYNKNGQQAIKKAKKNGIQIYEASYDELDDFKKVIDETGERRQFSTRDLSYYQSVYKSFGDQVKFLLAKINFQAELDKNQLQIDELLDQIADATAQNERKRLEKLDDKLSRAQKFDKEMSHFAATYGDEEVILAAAQFFIMPNEVLYMFSGMYDEFREFSAPFLIQDYMLNYAYEHQIDRYHFMGVNAPDNPEQGVLKFKQNFKGYIWQSSGNYELVIKPMLNKVTEILKFIIKR